MAEDEGKGARRGVVASLFPFVASLSPRPRRTVAMASGASDAVVTAMACSTSKSSMRKESGTEAPVAHCNRDDAQGRTAAWRNSCSRAHVRSLTVASTPS